MPKCKDCGARIRWAKTAAGRNMPVNEARVSASEGNVRIVDGVAIVLGVGDLEAAGPRYRAHWADCPAAAERRQAKPKAAPVVVELATPAQGKLKL